MNYQACDFLKKSIILFALVTGLVFSLMLPGSALAQDDESTVTVSSDELRQALIELLNEPAHTGNNQALVEVAHSSDMEMTDGIADFTSRISELSQSLPQYSTEFKTAFSQLAYPENQPDTSTIVLLIAGMLLLSLIAERLVIGSLLKRIYTHADVRDLTPGAMLKYATMRLIIHLFGLAIAFVLFSIGVSYFFKDNESLYFFTNLLVIAYFKARVWITCLRVILSPRTPGIRFLPLDSRSARKLYFWGTVFLALMAFSNMLTLYLQQAGMSELHINGINMLVTMLFNVIILSQVWLMRGQISRMILSHTEPHANEPHQMGLLRHLMIGTWPFILTLWLLLLWMLWQYKSFLGHIEHAQFVSLSWWVTLAFPLADRIFSVGIRSVTRLQWLHGPYFEARSARFVNNVQIGFRFVLLTLGVYLLSQGWGYQSEMMMAPSKWESMLSRSLDLFVVVIIAYVVWELANALIEKNLPPEEDALASLEGDGGGEGGSRTETLLPMVRTILSLVIGIMVLLVMLHSLGISIGPLLAGAGILGLAVGFGAQKLVQDFLSGVFFLIDDAFRRGEYIEVENIRGTVERISIRSMQLRHHLGAVQTVPYGEIKTVRNLSRDWITMKLELRLPYDTDIERVRKIIKRVGQEMLENEEIGPGFILPLKSQGVMRVEESALIVRMKFTCKPGEQWVIRREAYRRVRDELAQQGIHFAHREVRIRLSEEEENQQRLEAEAKQQLLSRGAAAAGGVIAAEAQRHSKNDPDDDDNDFGDDDR